MLHQTRNRNSINHKTRQIKKTQDKADIVKTQDKADTVKTQNKADIIENTGQGTVENTGQGRHSRKYKTMQT